MADCFPENFVEEFQKRLQVMSKLTVFFIVQGTRSNYWNFLWKLSKVFSSPMVYSRANFGKETPISLQPVPGWLMFLSCLLCISVVPSVSKQGKVQQPITACVKDCKQKYCSQLIAEILLYVCNLLSPELLYSLQRSCRKTSSHRMVGLEGTPGCQLVQAFCANRNI